MKTLLLIFLGIAVGATGANFITVNRQLSFDQVASMGKMHPSEDWSREPRFKLKMTSSTSDYALGIRNSSLTFEDLDRTSECFYHALILIDKNTREEKILTVYDMPAIFDKEEDLVTPEVDISIFPESLGDDLFSAKNWNVHIRTKNGASGNSSRLKIPNLAIESDSGFGGSGARKTGDMGDYFEIVSSQNYGLYLFPRYYRGIQNAE